MVNPTVKTAGDANLEPGEVYLRREAEERAKDPEAYDKKKGQRREQLMDEFEKLNAALSDGTFKLSEEKSLKKTLEKHIPLLLKSEVTPLETPARGKDEAVQITRS